MSLDGGVRPAIAKISTRAGGQQLSSSDARYAGGYQGFQADGQSGHVSGRRAQTFVAGRAASSINTPQDGGVGSQSRNPVGVSGGLPAGGFSNTGGYTGASGAPQTGSGQVAKAPGGAGGSGAPQKTTGTSANPYGKTTPPGESPKDAYTKALLQKIQNDRLQGEKSVIRDPETKKISEVDREKAQLDEKTKAEVAKLDETFKQDALELDKSIKEFQETFKDYLTGDKGNAKDKELNGILDDVVAKSKEDENGNKVGDNNYNPQGFFDAAEKLDKWVKDNPDDAKKYGEDLTEINEQVQSMKANREEEIALHENRPEGLIRAAEKAADNSSEEAGRLKENLDGVSESLPAEDKTKVDAFKTQLDETMEQINPEGPGFDVDKSNESLAALKKSYNELPDSLKEPTADGEDNELVKSFNEVSDFGRVAVEGQDLARQMEPDSAKFEQKATDFIQGADKFDAVEAEHRTAPEREADIREIIGDDALIDKAIAEEAESSENTDEASAIQPESSSPEQERANNLGADFAEDDFANIDTENFNTDQGVEDTRSLDQALDLEIDDTVAEESVDDIINEIEAEEVEEIEVPEIDIEEEIDEILEE